MAIDIREKIASSVIGTDLDLRGSFGPDVESVKRSELKNKLQVNVNRAGVVTLFLGQKIDMVILFVDPTKPRLHACKSVSTEEMAATRSLFDTEVNLSLGLVQGEERDVIRHRRLRLSEMLADLGREDIVGTMRTVGDLLRVEKRQDMQN